MEDPSLLLTLSSSPSLEMEEMDLRGLSNGLAGLREQFLSVLPAALCVCSLQGQTDAAARRL